MRLRALFEQEPPGLRKWFGNSKVVDSAGNPMVVYHGTKSDFDEFTVSRGGEFGSGIYFTPNPNTADMFGGFQQGDGNLRIIPAYLKMERPLITNDRNVPRGAGMKALIRKGYDGVIGIQPNGDKQYVVFDPRQVKSTFAQKFDPSSAKISEAPAFHGTPHQFDQFSTDHIGSGEGHRAFGWGLYFAGAKEVGEHYRTQLSQQMFHTAHGDMDQMSLIAFLRSGYKLSPLEDVAGVVAELVAGKDIQALAKQLSQSGRYAMAYALRDLAQEGFKVMPRGRLFSVDIPREDEFLLWDKPMDEQPMAVRAKLKAAGMRNSDYARWTVKPTTTGKFTVYNVWGMPAGTFRSEEAAQRKAKEQTAEHNTPGGAVFYHELANKLGSDKDASLALLAAGIPGIKYLDGQSREQGSGTYNYVVFDAGSVSITGVE